MRFSLLLFFSTAFALSAIADENKNEAAIAKAIANTKLCASLITVDSLPEPFDSWLSLTCTSTGQMITGKIGDQGQRLVGRRGFSDMNVHEEMDPQARFEKISQHGMQATNFKGFRTHEVTDEDLKSFTEAFAALFPDFKRTDEDQIHIMRIYGQTEDRNSHLAVLVRQAHLKYAIYIPGDPRNARVYQTIDRAEWDDRLQKRLEELEAMNEAERSKN